MAYMELSGTLFDHTRSKDEISGSFSLSKFLPRNSEMTGAWMRELLSGGNVADDNDSDNSESVSGTSEGVTCKCC